MKIFLLKVLKIAFIKLIKAKKILLFSTLVLLIFNTNVSQAKIIKYANPEISNFSPSDYGGLTQTWGITQGRDGRMFFANNYGVIIYDGKDWKIVEMPLKTAARSITRDMLGNIIVGGRSEFGYLSNSSKGAPSYQTLNHYLKDLGKVYDEPVYEAFNLSKKRILFRTKSNLFIYKNKSFSVIKTSDDSQFGVAHLIDGSVYVYIYTKGLHKLSNNKLELIPGTKIFSSKEDNIRGLIKDKNDLILFTYKNGIYRLSDGKSERIKYTNDIFNKSAIYRILKLKNNQIALATYNGIFLLDKNLKLQRKIDKKSGLRTDNVRTLYEDNEGMLWAGLDDGIAKINLNAKFNYFPKSNTGIEATVYSSAVFKNNFYLGTSKGLKKLKTDNNMLTQSFASIADESIKTQVWDMLEIQNQLFVASNNGFGYLDRKDNYHEVINYKLTGNIYKIYETKLLNNNILLGAKKGLFLIDKNTKKIILNLPMLGASNTKICELNKKREIWLRVKPKGLYRISVGSGDYKEIKNFITNFSTSNGLPDPNWNIPFEYNGDLAIGTPNGIYKFNRADNQFIPHELFKSIPNIKDKYFEGISNLNNGVRWVHFTERKNGKRHQEFYELNTVNNKIKNLYFDKVENYISASAVLHNEMSWIYGSEGVAIAVPYKDVASLSKTILSKVINNRNIIYDFRLGGDIFKDSMPMKSQYVYKENNFKFHFSATSFVDEKKNKFRFKLEGFDEFSEFSKNNQVSYSNLKPGDYTLIAESFNGEGKKLEPYKYRFNISLPWWQEFYFYVGEGIFFFCLLFFTILSKTSSTGKKLATSLTFILILIIFEYVNFIADPYFYELTGGIPVFSMASKVILGCLLVPFERVTSNILDMMANKMRTSMVQRSAVDRRQKIRRK
jgi:ligand-binding sensor domain-containing protein